MKNLLVLLFGVFLMVSCSNDMEDIEYVTLNGYWELSELNGVDVTDGSFINFINNSVAEGETSCNMFSFNCDVDNTKISVRNFAFHSFSTCDISYDLLLEQSLKSASDFLIVGNIPCRPQLILFDRLGNITSKWYRENK